MKMKFKLSCLLAGLIMVAGCSANEQKESRAIKVKTVNGSVIVNKNDKINKDFKLNSGDTMKTKEKGSAVLQLDDDKFVYVEEKAELQLKATGTDKKSKTEIILKEGSITNEIKNKLSDGSTYEIITEKTTISVQGTIYRVSVVTNKQGDKEIFLEVFDGKVSVSVTNKDGKKDKIVVEKGQAVQINDTKGEYIKDKDGKINHTIDYDTLPKQALEHLIEIKTHSNKLDYISDEVLKNALKKQNLNEKVKNNNKTETTKEKENNKDAKSGDKTNTSKEEESNKNFSNSNTTNTTNTSKNDETNTDKGQGNENSNKQDKPIPVPPTTNTDNNGSSTVVTPEVPNNGIGDEYADTGGYPDDGVHGMYGKYFPSFEAAKAWMDNPDAEYQGYIFTVVRNDDGSVRLTGRKDN